jgi:hypothetical protein
LPPYLPAEAQPQVSQGYTSAAAVALAWQADICGGHVVSVINIAGLHYADRVDVLWNNFASELTVSSLPAIEV